MDAKTLCLGVLALGEASGYEIRKQFEEGPFAYFHETSFGSIYPALTSLAEQGLVVGRVVEQSGKPDKKVYSITEAGRAAFRAALHRPPAFDRIRSESLYMLFFAEWLDPAHRSAVYNGYLAAYRDQVVRLEAVDAACADPANAEGILKDALGDCSLAAMCIGDGREESPQRKFTRGLGLALYRTMVGYLEENQTALFEALDEEDRTRRPGDVA